MESLQPAPSLTILHVTEIKSTEGGDETISPGQLSTAKPHGGNNIDFYTIEYGFGNNPVAQFKTNGQPHAKNIPETSREEIIDPATNLGIGYRKIFTYSGEPVSGGEFTYQNTSENKPWNTMSTRLTLQPLKQKV
jgi:hypothetical protein